MEYKILLGNKTDLEYGKLILEFPIPSGCKINDQILSKMCEENQIDSWNKSLSKIKLIWGFLKKEEIKVIQLKFKILFQVKNRLKFYSFGYLQQAKQQSLVFESVIFI